MKMRCIARAYGDKPLDRLALGHGSGMIFIVNPACSGTDQELAAESIGFPASAIFEFDEDVYERLVSALKEGNRRTLLAAWNEARPLMAHLPDIDSVLAH